MSGQKPRARRARVEFGWGGGLEPLEVRAVPATFTTPSLTALLRQARSGVNTAPAVIDTMLASFQSQLKSGPLADLSAGTVDGNGYVTEVQELAASFGQSATTQLSPSFPNVTQMLVLQGQRAAYDAVAVNQQVTAGVIPSTNLVAYATAAVDAITAGPVYSLGTPLSGFEALTQSVVASLNVLPGDLSSTSSVTLTVDQARATLDAVAEGYRANVQAGLQITHPTLARQVDASIDQLEAAAAAALVSGNTDAATQLSTAIALFSADLIGSTGYFASTGSIGRAIAGGSTFPATPRSQRAAVTVASVSGTAANGTGSLTATLTAGGKPVAGVPVTFTLDGAFAGLVVTGTDGVASLTGVTTTAAVGTSTGAVVATFPGNYDYQSGFGTGDLTVGQTSTALSAVSGTATFGGPATLTATLKTGAGVVVSGVPVAFTLNGTSVGSATTNASGVATLTGVTSTAGAGTATGVVGATFAGNGTYDAAPNVAGNLVVGKASTSLGSVSATAPFGGPATLKATLVSTTTNLPIAGATVSFTFAASGSGTGTSVGTATTDANGVATLTNITTTAAIGTYAGAVTASYAGDTNNNAAANASGSLVVSQAASTLTASGTAVYNEPATLTATLTGGSANTPIVGALVTFTLNGTTAGTGTTNASGVATFTTAAGSTTNQAGTNTGVVGASFAGNTNYTTSTTTGDLAVSKAPTAFSAVGATATTGGHATYTATLKGGTTSQTPLAGVLVTFTNGATDVGTATTDASGVATFTDNTNTITDPAGTYTAVVGVSATAPANYDNPTSAKGDLVVS